MVTGYIDFEGKGAVAVKLSNGEERVVSTTMIAHNIGYKRWYEDHYGNGMGWELFAEAEDIDEKSDITFPYPDEFTYEDTGEEDTNGLEIVSLVEIIDVDWEELDETFIELQGD